MLREVAHLHAEMSNQPKARHAKLPWLACPHLRGAVQRASHHTAQPVLKTRLSQASQPRTWATDHERCQPATMELPRAPGSHDHGILPELGVHLRQLQGPGHHFSNTTARDNARVQYGDQYHHHYHAGGPTAVDLEAKRLKELLKALAFPQMSFRFAAIANAYSSTCQ
jgi:hypothetical protein